MTNVLFQIEAAELLRLIGTGSAAAAAVFGVFYSVRARQTKGDATAQQYWFALELLTPAVVGALLLCVGWVWSAFVAPTPTLFARFPALVLFLLALLGAFLVTRFSKTDPAFRLELLYVVMLFGLIGVMLAPLAYSAGGIFALWRDAIVLLLFGTSAMVGHLYSRVRFEKPLRKYFFPLLPLFAKMAWVGAGLFVLLEMVAWDQRVVLDDRFVFRTLLLGILVLTGSVITGPLLSWLQKKTARHTISRRMDALLLALGALGLISMVGLFATDALLALTWGLPRMLLLYVVGFAVSVCFIVLAEYDC